MVFYELSGWEGGWVGGGGGGWFLNNTENIKAMIIKLGTSENNSFEVRITS